MAENARDPNPIDVHVGRQLAIYRRVAGMSQEALGDAIGVTFQQVQKYEKGSNRVGASRLFLIGKALDVPISVFFAGLNAEDEGAHSVPDATARDGLDLLAAFRTIEDEATRRHLVGLARSIAGYSAGSESDEPDA